VSKLADEIEELGNFREFCIGMEAERPKGIAVDNNPSHFTEQADYCDARLAELDYPRCPNGHIAHYENDGSYETPFVWLACSECDYRSERFDSVEQLEAATR
jgi:hypothetical protein